MYRNQIFFFCIYAFSQRNKLLRRKLEYFTGVSIYFSNWKQNTLLCLFFSLNETEQVLYHVKRAFDLEVEDWEGKKKKRRKSHSSEKGTRLGCRGLIYNTMAARATASITHFSFSFASLFLCVTSVTIFSYSLFVYRDRESVQGANFHSLSCVTLKVQMPRAISRREGKETEMKNIERMFGEQ